MPTPARAPKQARSVESLERILSAAEEILATKDFREASLSEIAAHAGYTIGAIYARFADKRALRDALEARLFEHIRRLTSARAVPDAWTGRPLHEVVRDLVDDSISLFRDRRGALRAIIVEARTDPELAKRIATINQETLNRLTAAVKSQSARLTHPHPVTGAMFAAFTLSSVLRDVLLFDAPWPPQIGRSHAALARELTRLVMRYLGAPEDA